MRDKLVGEFWKEVWGGGGVVYKKMALATDDSIRQGNGICTY